MDGNVLIMSSSFMGMNFTTEQMNADAPHEAGGALQTIDSTLHVIAQRSITDPGQPIPSHDVSGWMTAVSESLPPSPPTSQMLFAASSDLLGSTLCPPAPVGPPGPGYIAPPAFLARATGTGQHGAFSTEIFVGACVGSAAP
jgi:hypothetical protein